MYICMFMSSEIRNTWWRIINHTSIRYDVSRRFLPSFHQDDGCHYHCNLSLTTNTVNNNDEQQRRTNIKHQIFPKVVLIILEGNVHYSWLTDESATMASKAMMKRLLMIYVFCINNIVVGVCWWWLLLLVRGDEEENEEWGVRRGEHELFWLLLLVTASTAAWRMWCVKKKEK